MRLYPVNPDQLVLANSSGTKRSAEAPSPPSDPPSAADLTISSFKSQSLTGSLMLDLGFASMRGQSDSEFAFYLLSFSFVDPNLRTEESVDGPRAFQWGTAVRIGISVKRTKANASLNLASISASTTIEGGSTTVEAKFHGMDLSLAARLGDQIPLGAPFDSTMMYQIGIMTGLFQESIQSEPALIMPDRLAATHLLSGAGANYAQGVSAAYALHRMTKGDDLNSALKRLGGKLSGSHKRKYLYEGVTPWVVESVYSQINNGAPFASLSKEAKKNAHAIYDNTKGK